MIFRFKTFSLDTANFELRSGEDLIAVEPQVFGILAYLIENRERVVGKDELIEAVWSGRAVSDGSLNTRINAARRAVGDSGSTQSVIKTFTRRGFRFMAEVTESPADDTHSSSNLVRSDKPSVAVLPFENMSDDPGQEYFADGISEDLLTELSRNEELIVIGRHSSFAFKGTKTSLKQIGQELSVQYVVEGSVRQSGKRVRITAELVDTRTDKQMWAERFDRDVSDILEIQDAVTKAIADCLAVRLRPESGERRRLPTSNLQAYELFSRGRLMINPPTRDNLVQARRALARVVELDPDFAGGYAGLSTVYGYFVMHNFSDDPERDIQRAQELAEEALRRDARLSLPHIALGLSQLVKGDHQAAIAAARTATDVQPNDPEAHAFLGHFLLYAGNADAAIDALHVALELNPKHVQSVYMNLLAAAKWVAGRFDESAATFQRNVDGGGFCGRPAMVFWTAALQCAGRNAEAKEKAEELLSTMPSLTISTVPIIKLFARPEYRERLAQALRAAGIPNH